MGSSRPGRSRRPLLSLGRRSLSWWVRPDVVAEPGLRRDLVREYGRLQGTVPWPAPIALRLHLAFSVLPGAALYASLRRRGWEVPLAVEAVRRTLADMAAPHRRRLRRLMRHRLLREAFLPLVARVTPVAFPAPGWQVSWRERSRTTVAFDMTRCFDLEMLRLLGCPEITPAYCAVDDVLYSGMAPQLCWRRTGTLATGAAYCDFRYERVAR